MSAGASTPQEAPAAPEAAAAPRRPSRFWLYAPFVLLVLLAAAWTAAWFFIRGRVADGVDAWLAAEAAAGRQWTCADRVIAGYPFRIELSCSDLRLQGPDLSGSLGPVGAVAQVYQPRHVIVLVGGPLRLVGGAVTASAEWRRMEASVRVGQGGLQRASLFAQAPRLGVTGLPTDVALSSESLNLHVRPSPTRTAEGAVDVAAAARGARVPALDALAGGAEPADLQIDLTVTEADEVSDGLTPEGLDRWREAGGRVDLLLLSVAKGPRRLEAKGSLRLDEGHRPAGQLTLAGAGLDDLVANLTGNRSGGLLGALLGQAAKAQNPGGTPGLAPLPPVRLDNGRVSLGPFTVPNARLPALY
ncbi:MAG TPA: DUF2125 domain-containing protein [Microvirga sp.]|nr:DUF2125 domain-containing protein [Microvirga sp.]